MLPFKLVYSDEYFLPIGSHVFPAEKYRRVHDQLLATAVADESDFVTPRPASDQDILLVHTPRYVQKLKTGTLSRAGRTANGDSLLAGNGRAFWLPAGGSILAAERALQDGVAINIGGGFHHAFPDHGEGFCMIHDVAVAIRRVVARWKDSSRHDGRLRCSPRQRYSCHFCRHAHSHRAAAFNLFGNLPATPGKMRHAHAGDVFTISLHQHNNYPA